MTPDAERRALRPPPPHAAADVEAPGEGGVEAAVPATAGRGMRRIQLRAKRHPDDRLCRLVAGRCRRLDPAGAAA